MSADFIRNHLQSTTKSDHIIITFLRNNDKAPTYICNYVWSETDIRDFIINIMASYPNSEYTTSTIYRKILNGIYMDISNTTEIYTIELKDYLDLPQEVCEFRHITERTTAFPSLNTADDLLLDTRIERTEFNIRNKFYIQILKNKVDMYAIQIRISHPQDTDRLIDMVEQFRKYLPV